MLFGIPLHHIGTSKMVKAFDDFLSQVEIPRARKQLRSLLLYYLSEECEELAPDYGHFIEDMKFLFDFLDVVEDELSHKA
ncbi:MAG: hypothetical protein ABJG78_13200 [Cyclobacteriaceae bacterium]